MMIKQYLYNIFNLKAAIFYLAAFFVFSCNNKSASIDSEMSIEQTLSDTAALNQLPKDSQVKLIAYNILSILKSKDYIKLESYIHHRKGISFSPYCFVDLNEDIRLVKSHFKNYLINQKTTKLKWGVADGSGDDIVLTLSEYFEKYVYNKNYIEAKQVAINKTLATTNTINNVLETFADQEVIEYYIPGSDPKYDGMDWGSLILVLEKIENQFYLIGLVHNQWTI